MPSSQPLICFYARVLEEKDVYARDAFYFRVMRHAVDIVERCRLVIFYFILSFSFLPFSRHYRMMIAATC